MKFKKALQAILERILPVYGVHSFQILVNKIKGLAYHKKKNHKYLFILSPPYCGSTLLNEVISTSKSVSVNNIFGNREGQTLPTVRKHMFDGKRRWQTETKFDWHFIKKEWMKYWDLSKSILLEKSPPNVFRAQEISENFQPCFFIIFYRNPYAHCESLIRRGYSARQAAEIAIRFLDYQKRNIEKLDNAIVISYENFTSAPQKAKQMILDFLPELGDLNTDMYFSAHNFKSNKKMKIENLNEEKIDQLTDTMKKGINSIFEDHSETLNYFDYEIMK